MASRALADTVSVNDKSAAENRAKNFFKKRFFIFALPFAFYLTPECAIVFITPDCRIMKRIIFGRNIIRLPAAAIP